MRLRCLPVAVTGFIVCAIFNMTCIMTSGVLYCPFQKFRCKVLQVQDLIYLVLILLFNDIKYGRKRDFCLEVKIILK